MKHSTIQKGGVAKSMYIFFAFVVIFILFYHFYKMNNELKQKIGLLEQQLLDFKRRLLDLEKQEHHLLEEKEVSLVQQSENRSNEMEVLNESSIQSTEESVGERQETQAIYSTDPVAEPVKKKKETKRKSRTRTEWEMLIGGKWLNWIGAVALFLGAAFFMKYAFDNNWINEIARVVIGAIFGGSLLFIGGRFAKKGLTIFSQGLVGTGIAVLYAAVFAAYNFYGLLPQLAAMIAMLVVTMLCFQQAIFYQSLPVASLGWIGAFGTPFLLSGEGSVIGLMSYLALILTGMLALVWKKHNWMILYYLSFFTTYLIFFSISLLSNGEEVSVYLGFLICFWFLFYLFDMWFLFYTKTQKSEKTVGIINTIMLAYGVLLHLASMSASHIMVSISMFLVGIAYFLPIAIFHYLKKLKEANHWQVARQGITFLVFIIIATYHYFDIPAFLFVTCLEVAIIIWWGLRYQVKFVERFGLGVLSLVSVTIFLYTISGSLQGKSVINWVFGNALLCAIVLLCSAHWYNQNSLKKIRNSLHVAWSILLFAGIYVEGHIISLQLFPRMYTPLMGSSMNAWNDPLHLSYMTDLIVVFCLLVYAVMVLYFALKRNVHFLVVTGNAMLGAMLLYLVVSGVSYPVWEFYTPVWNIRVLVFVLSVVLLYVSYRLWKGLDIQHPWYKWFRLSAILAMSLLIFEILTVEIIDGFAKQIHIATKENLTAQHLENQQFYSVVLVWIFCSIPMYVLGVKLRYRLLTYVGLSTLGLGTIPILFQGISYYSYQHFVPIVNLRFLSFVCVIGVFVFFYQYLKKDQQASRDPYLWYIRQSVFFLGVFAVFLCVTMEISDTFESTVLRLGTQNAEVVKWSNLQQLSISSAWLLLSCFFLWIGIWKKNQSVRIMSICIFGISILKIFLFDLSFLTTLYRIFSFMGLGIILLAVSFVYQKYKHWFLNEEAK
jgi:uncharacterized membrane protein